MFESKYLIRKSSRESIWLDSFGPTQEENEWSNNRKTAYKMSEQLARLRLQSVHKWFSEAIIEKE